MNEPDDKYPPETQLGIARRRAKGYEGVGRKPDWFVKRCQALACDWRFFKFAKLVLEGQPIEPRLTSKGAVIYVEASVSDKVYLWEKLAAYGFGKPKGIDAASPERSVQHAEAAMAVLKLMQEASRNGSYAQPSYAGTDPGGAPPSVVEGRLEPHPEGPATPPV